MTTQVLPFPDVDEDRIRQGAREASGVVDLLISARHGVATVRGSDSWRSPSARPSWDDALEQRAADLAAAREVTAHLQDVLTTAATQLTRYRGEYDHAVARVTAMGDPTQQTDPTLGGLLPGEPPAPPDPAQVAAYEKLVRHCNDIVADAEMCLAVCASEMLAMTTGVTFTDPAPPIDFRAPVGPDRIILPFAPAFGAPSTAIYVNGVPIHLTRGRAFEAEVLRALGITGEAKTFFRPDANGNYNLPRTRSGRLYRGTFPDSLRLGILEIKSGTTQVRLSAQISIQLWVADTVGRSFNLVVSPRTPVDPLLVERVQETGGSVYYTVRGNTYYDAVEEEYVRLRGEPHHERTPLTAEEVETLPRKLREAIEKIAGRNPPGPPTGAGGSGGGARGAGAGSPPYLTQQEYQQGLSEVGPDGLRHYTAPGVRPPKTGSPLPTGPIVPLPGLPVPAPVPVPVFPGLPIPVPVLP